MWVLFVSVCVCVCTSICILNLATESKLYAIVMLMDMKGYNQELIHKYRVYISRIEDTLSWQCIHSSAWQEGDLFNICYKLRLWICS